MINVKIDTKEKFTVITPQEMALAANMTGDFNDLLLPYLQKDIPHIVLNLNAIKQLDEATGNYLADIQQQFYENNCSFVICNLQDTVEKLLDEKELLELMKPTACLINTSRGQLIAERDLADALQQGKLAAAALDVLSTEPPLAGHPLCTGLAGMQALQDALCIRGDDLKAER